MSLCNHCGSQLTEDALYCSSCGKPVMPSKIVENQEKIEGLVKTKKDFPRKYKLAVLGCFLCIVSAFITYQMFTTSEAVKHNDVKQPIQMVQEKPNASVTAPPSQVAQQREQPKELTQEEKTLQSVNAAKMIMSGSWPNQDNPYILLGETAHGRIYLDTFSVERRNDGVYAVALLVVKNDSSYRALISEYIFSPDKKRMYTGSMIFILNNGDTFGQVKNSWSAINPNTPASAVCKAAWERLAINN